MATVSTRIWIGTTGPAELMPDAPDGTPVVANDDGVERMTELTGVISIEIGE